LYCHSCTNLKSISSLPKLRTLICDDCRILTSTPLFPELETLHCPGCTWMKERTDHEQNILNLKRCQAIFRRKLAIRKLLRLIPAITLIFYLPGCKGEFLAMKHFQKTIEND